MNRSLYAVLGLLLVLSCVVLIAVAVLLWDQNRTEDDEPVEEVEASATTDVMPTNSAAPATATLIPTSTPGEVSVDDTVATLFALTAIAEANVSVEVDVEVNVTSAAPTPIPPTSTPEPPTLDELIEGIIWQYDWWDKDSISVRYESVEQCRTIGTDFTERWRYKNLRVTDGHRTEFLEAPYLSLLQGEWRFYEFSLSSCY